MRLQPCLQGCGSPARRARWQEPPQCALGTGGQVAGLRALSPSVPWSLGRPSHLASGSAISTSISTDGSKTHLTCTLNGSDTEIVGHRWVKGDKVLKEDALPGLKTQYECVTPTRRPGRCLRVPAGGAGPRSRDRVSPRPLPLPVLMSPPCRRPPGGEGKGRGLASDKRRTPLCSDPMAARSPGSAGCHGRPPGPLGLTPGRRHRQAPSLASPSPWLVKVSGT